MVQPVFVYAQEINATVTVNSAKIKGNRQLFNTLENELRSFINNRKWTDADFQSNERIDCSFTLVINEMPTTSSFKGELLVQSRRPVFNTAYITPMLNFRDAQFDFEYIEYQPIEFDVNRLQSNLVATIAFYVNLVLAIDFDSMSPMGGTPYFRQMQLIAENAQSNGWSGWESSFGAQRNRYGIISEFNNASQESYREMWYNYHRLGLDEMANNAEKGREKIVSSLPVISSIHARSANSVLITLFADAKLDELVHFLALSTENEKQTAYETLMNIYPTRTTELEKLKIMR